MGLSIPNLVLEIFLKACFIISLLYCRPLLKKDMTVTIISRHSKTIHKLVEEQMKKEAQELGFDPWGDSAQEEFERRVTDLEQHALDKMKMTWKSYFMSKRVLAEKQMPLLSF